MGLKIRLLGPSCSDDCRVALLMRSRQTNPSMVCLLASVILDCGTHGSALSFGPFKATVLSLHSFLPGDSTLNTPDLEASCTPFVFFHVRAINNLTVSLIYVLLSTSHVCDLKRHGFELLSNPSSSALRSPAKCNSTRQTLWSLPWMQSHVEGSSRV